VTLDEIIALEPGKVLRDDVVPGLHVRALPTQKVYYLYFRTKTGTERRPRLGETRTLSLAAARRVAREMLEQVAAGRDPIAERDATKAIPTVGALLDFYLDNRKERKTVEDARRAIGKDLRPRFGTRRATELSAEEVEALHTAMTKRGQTIANRTLEYLSAAYNLALEKRKLPAGTPNPCDGIAWHQERKRKRYMRSAEFPKFKEILDREAASAPQSVAFMWIALFSGARPGEIVAARREWLERRETPAGVVGILHLPDAKTGARDVVLPPSAMAVIDRLPSYPTGTLLGLKRHPRDWWRRIRREMGAPDLWVRDMRRSFATVALSSGTPLGVVGELLGHADPQTTMIYARLMDDTAERAVVQTAAVIERLMQPAPDPEPVRESTHDRLEMVPGKP
jgi:integrase